MAENSYCDQNKPKSSAKPPRSDCVQVAQGQGSGIVKITTRKNMSTPMSENKQ